MAARNEGAVGPDAALVAGEDPRVDQDLQVVGDGRLGEAKGFGQLADAGRHAYGMRRAR